MRGIRKTRQYSSSFQYWIMRTVAGSSKWLLCSLILVSYSGFLHRDYRPRFACQALTSSTTPKFTYPTTSLTSLGKSQLAVLDGPEWNSVKSVLRDTSQQNPKSLSSKYGYMKVVTGRDETNRRVVAMLCIDSDGSQQQDLSVYEESVAVIPNKISDADAISTYIASLSAIHCALPRVENVGGSGDGISATISTGKAVVLGSGDLACFTAEGLASLGMHVYLVNNKGNANVRTDVGKLEVIKPAVGDTGFASYLGEFDCLVDTIGNERSASGAASLDDHDDDDEEMISLGESVLQMLRRRHKCYNYVSTLTYSQDVVASGGLFGGPGKADGNCEKVGNINFLTRSRDSQSINPPVAVGNTIEKLLKNGVIFTAKQRRKSCSKKSDAIRGWSLADFWEQMSWPRDSSGSGSTRFGLPVREDPDGLDIGGSFIVSEAPYNPLQANKGDTRGDDYDDIGEFGSSPRASPSPNPKNRAIQNNPYVLNIMDVDGLQSEIVNTKKNCIMFMSARFCKTCKTINPAYTRMARVSQENGSASNFSFVKAETSGASGKELAAHMSVRAVPSFVFVREGKILGQAYTSKLPSPKIDKALQLLASGEEWDYSFLDDDE